MAIAIASLANSSSTANQSTAYATGSVTSTTGAWLCVWITGTPASINWTVTGHSLTWAAETPKITISTNGGQLFVAFVTSGATGALSLTPSGAATGCTWNIFQITGASSADVLIGTPVTNSGTGVSTLAVNTIAQSNSNNRPLACYLTTNDVNNTITAPANWTEVGEATYLTPSAKGWVGWASATYPASMTLTEDSTYDIAGAMFQIQAPVAAKLVTPVNRARFRASLW